MVKGENTSWVRRHRRVLVRLAIGAGCVGLLVVAFGAAMWLRIDRFSVSLPGSAPGGRTYLLIGSDSRAGLDPDARFSSTREHPGKRANIVILVRIEGDRIRLMPVPRDLLVLRADGTFTRLALTLLKDEQAVVDTVCRSLRIGIN